MVGYLDDLLLPAGIAVPRWSVPDVVMEECRERAAAEVDVGRTRWFVAALVVVAWAALALRAPVVRGLVVNLPARGYWGSDRRKQRERKVRRR